MVELTKCIHYHMPKTGGSWVTTVLKHICEVVNMSRGHQKEGVFSKKNKKAFTFVRHPVSWYISSYFYEVGMGNKPNDGWVLAKYTNLKFDRFAEMMSIHHKGILSNYVKEFCKNMDYIGRQENLWCDLLNILEEIGEPYRSGGLKIEKENVGNYAISIDRGTQRLIENSERWLMDRFYHNFSNNGITPKMVLNEIR